MAASKQATDLECGGRRVEALFRSYNNLFEVRTSSTVTNHVILYISVNNFFAVKLQALLSITNCTSRSSYFATPYMIFRIHYCRSNIVIIITVLIVHRIMECYNANLNMYTVGAPITGHQFFSRILT